MAEALTKCRICKKETWQTVVRVVDTLPPYVHVVQCNSCSNLTVAKFEFDVNNL